MGSFGFMTSIMNTRAEAKITLIEIYHPLLESSNNASKRFYLEVKEYGNQTIEIDSNFDMNISVQVDEENSQINTSSSLNFEYEQALKKLSEECFLECALKIHYDSLRIGAGSDTYKFIKNDNTYSIIKVEQPINLN